MDSFFRLSEESLDEFASGNGHGHGLLREETNSTMEYLAIAPSVKTFQVGVEAELEVFQHQPQNLNQEVAQSTNCKLPTTAGSAPSRYESQKRRDWNSFGQYLRNHRPPIALEQCSGSHVIDFLRYLDQFGKTKVHVATCHYFGVPNPPHPCPCPLRQAWGSLDALIGRLRAAFEENGGKASMNPFGARLIRLYLREVREKQAKARGIAYGKKKKGRISPQTSNSMLPVVSRTASTNQLPYGAHEHQFSQQLPGHSHGGNVHGSVTSNFSIHHGHDSTASLRSSASQGYAHAVDSFSLSNSAVNLVSRVYPPFEIHSFMEDLPSRDATGWVWNPVCS